MRRARHLLYSTLAMIALQGFLVPALFAPPAVAQTIRKLFNKEDIYRLSVEGLRLNITQEDADKVLRKNDWQGQWAPYTGPEASFSFKRDGQVLYLLRYRTSDSQLRIWSIVMKQRFGRASEVPLPANHILGQVWIDSVEAHYGEPSVDFLNPNGMAYVYYLSNQYREDSPRLEIYLGSEDMSYELSDRSLLSSP